MPQEGNENYPIGGSIERYDIEREKELLKKEEDEFVDSAAHAIAGMFAKKAEKKSKQKRGKS